jgi:hypothetical protein
MAIAMEMRTTVITKAKIAFFIFFHLLLCLDLPDILAYLADGVKHGLENKKPVFRPKDGFGDPLRVRHHPKQKAPKDRGLFRSKENSNAQEASNHPHQFYHKPV